MNGNMRRPGQGRPAGGARPAPRSGAPSVSGRRPTAGNSGGRPPMRRGINKWLIVGAIAVLVIVVIVIAVAAGSGKKSPNKPVILPYDTGGTGGPAETEPAGAPLSYTEITLLSAGDVMYHNPQLYEAYNDATGQYDFSPTYQYVKNLVSSADYAVVNFEGTTAGDAFEYSGYPAFNVPDSGMSVLKDAGFDMLLFANNHCYDTGHVGLIRTQENFVNFGFDYAGARLDASGKTYRSVDVKGVRLGILNSTDDISYGAAPGTINGIPIAAGDGELMDIFDLSELDAFYARVSAAITDLKAQGADLIVYYIHWGEEYHLTHNEAQAAIAQKLCDLGVDVIIGSHPHVVEDAEVLTSTVDPGRKTLCFYSLGNYVSNQNRLTMDAGWDSEYTENGLTVILTVRKYSNGQTMVTNVEIVLTWVHRYTDSTTWQDYHVIVPLPAAVNSPGEYGLYASDFGLAHAEVSYRQTTEQMSGVVEAFAQTVILPTDD
ncbi:MAG: CapA family protein [Clostridia bacterium]|nr:CapA family protein [Clostridia bacterium]